MTTPAEIAATAAIIRDAGIPDFLNRWLTMTPEALAANETARGALCRARIAPPTSQVLLEEEAMRRRSSEKLPPGVTEPPAIITESAPCDGLTVPLAARLDGITKDGAMIDFKTATQPESWPAPLSSTELLVAQGLEVTPDIDFTAHRHPCLAVACPDCKARVGVWCKRPSGHKAMDLHAERKRAADAAWEAGGFPLITQVGPEKFVYDDLPIEGTTDTPKPGLTKPGAAASAAPDAAEAAKPEENTVKTKTSKGKKASARTRVKGKTTAKPGAEARAGSKLATIVAMLTRPQGCTTKDVLKVTGWPAVSMPQQARAAGLTLKKEKVDGVTVYRAA